MSDAVREVRPAGKLPQWLELLEMIKFQHALFALPFAFTGMLAAAQGWPTLRQFLLISACMVTARTAAMTWNRIADRRFDAENPRTKDRALPAGRVSLPAAWALLGVAVLAFVATAAALNPMTLALSPVALLVVLGYSWTKRVTWGSHFVLGLSLALAPIGAWVAVRGSLAAAPLLLGLAVGAWTAGFDLLYACQDVDFDRQAGLHSLPARFGIAKALTTSRVLHGLTAIALTTSGVVMRSGPAFFAAVALAIGVLIWAQTLVRPGDLSRVGIAFFQANVAVGMLVLTGTALDLLM